MGNLGAGRKMTYIIPKIAILILLTLAYWLSHKTELSLRDTDLSYLELFKK